MESERSAVQDPLISYAIEIGWVPLSRDEATTLRRGETGALLYSTLRRKLIDLNPGVVTVENVDGIVDRIESVRTNIEGNAEILKWLRGQQSVYVESEKRERNVQVIDFGHPSENIFHVTDEWQFTTGRREESGRADVMFVVNGIPVAIVETKSARRSEAIQEGFDRIKKYHRLVPEMMTHPQVFDLTNLLEFRYGVTWNLDHKNVFDWKDEEPGNFEKKVKRFFARERFLKMLRHWIIFFKKDDELNKIVLRQHQSRAVEKVVERALDPAKSRGLVWHTQGSGKTFTMIEAAEQILRQPAFEKPTVLMLVDRTELESQLFGNLTAYGISPVVAQSKKHLKEVFESDYRGLIVSMIHKFDGTDSNLCTRENVFVLVDEAHRSTSGELGTYLVGALPNATLIGFTGTPIDRIAYGKGTFKVFGKDDPKGYLDKYSIAESIEDGTTLELHYQLAPNEMRVPREQLEKEFLDLAEAEGVTDIEDLNRILDRAVRLKVFLKSPERVQRVAAFVAKDFKERVEPLGYKAFLVGVDREACALYKEALDRHLPAEYSAVVFSAQLDDDERLRRFHFREDVEKKIRKAFTKAQERPKILIVTEKLLTGFDAPILYCMYLDKPMRDHTLLQAIARVNRPYENEAGIRKKAGFVLDFVGVFEKLEKALAFDPETVSSVIKNIDRLKERFASLMGERAPGYLALCRDPVTDKTIEAVVENFSDPDKRKVFVDFFKELEGLFEIISPDVFLRPFLPDYESLAMLYEVVRSNFRRRSGLYQEVANKTEQLVREKAEAYGVESAMPLVEIDESTLETIKAKGTPGRATVINLGRSIVSTVDREPRQPFLIPIGQRADEVLESYEDRQTSTEQAIDTLSDLVKEFQAAKREFEESGFDVNSFSIYWTLKQADVEKPEELAPKVEAAIQKFPNFLYDMAALRKVKAELYKVLLPSVAKERMVELAEKILRLERQ